MEYYGNNDWRDYLALQHHGILGMKWGKRNGPPYPLGVSDHSASEKKAGWRKSLSVDSSSIRKKARYINKETKRATKRYDKEIKKSDKKVKKSFERYASAAAAGSKSADKRREVYEDAKFDNDYVRRLKNKELDRINSMTSKDISEEKKAVAKNRLDRFRNVQKEGFIEGGITNKTSGTKTDQLKSKRRVGDSERNQLKDEIKAVSEAKKPLPKTSKNIIEDYGRQYDPSKTDEINTTRYNNLFSKINTEIVDTYNGKAHTARTKRVINSYEPRLKELSRQSGAYDLNSPYRKLQKEYQDKMASAVLKDLGYSDTKKSRDWLIDNWFIFYD